MLNYRYVHQFFKIRKFSPCFVSEMKSVTPITHYLTIVVKIIKNIYLLENFRANVLKQSFRTISYSLFINILLL